MKPAAWVARHGLRGGFGLSPGDRVAIVMRNRPEYLEALFAIWPAGLVAVQRGRSPVIRTAVRRGGLKAVAAGCSG